MIAKIIVIGWLAAALSIHSAVAQEQQQQAEQANLQSGYRACLADGCIRQLRVCLPSEEGKSNPPLCDTGYIVCRIACQDCGRSYARCIRESRPSEVAFCDQELGACRQRSADNFNNLSSRALVTYEGGDGSSQENAVIIKGARDGTEGIVAEYVWILKNRSDWEFAGQSLISGPEGKHFDRIEYNTPEGKRTIFYDISEFFGK